MTIYIPPTVFVLLMLATITPQETRTAEPSLGDLTFMTGCWEGTFQSSQGEGVIEEHYSTPSDNVMLGTTRYLLQNRTQQYEFALIQRDSTGIHLVPYPGGVRSEAAFRLTSVEGAAAVFEAPEHDFPKRIMYRRGDKGTLVAHIDGGPDDTDGRGWTLSPAPCF